MDTKTYNVNLKAKKTSWGGLALNLSKNGKLLGGVNKPMDSEMALVLTSKKKAIDQFYSNCEMMELIPDEFVLSPELDNCTGTFAGLLKVKSIDVSRLDTSNINNMTNMFANCQEIQELDLFSFNVDNVTTFLAMFQKCYKLKTVDLTGWNTSNATVFTRMFGYCSELEEIKGVIDITNAKTFSDMFTKCNKLKQIKIKATPDQQQYFRSTAKLSSDTEVIFV